MTKTELEQRFWHEAKERAACCLSRPAPITSRPAITAATCWRTTRPAPKGGPEGAHRETVGAPVGFIRVGAREFLQ
jgi:hypothetical protein